MHVISVYDGTVIILRVVCAIKCFNGAMERLARVCVVLEMFV